LTIVHKETIRLTALLNDFLDIQRMESGRQTYRFARLELTPLLRESVELFARGDTGHTFAIEAPDGLPLVYADADRIRQVLSNLLSNAVKYSPQGGRVHVEARREGAYMLVWVSDQGIGMTPDNMRRLFTKFYRVDNAETRRIGGSGLGLALIKEIIEAHKGRVWVESELGQGSTFFFTLPVAG
jgi:signal transduction histidine kinase